MTQQVSGEVTLCKERTSPKNILTDHCADRAPHSTPGQITPLAYRPRDACRVLGVGPTSLYNLIRSGKLVPKKIGKATLILHADLEKLLAG